MPEKKASQISRWRSLKWVEGGQGRKGSVSSQHFTRRNLGVKSTNLGKGNEESRRAALSRLFLDLCLVKKGGTCARDPRERRKKRSLRKTYRKSARSEKTINGSSKISILRKRKEGINWGSCSDSKKRTINSRNGKPKGHASVNQNVLTLRR